MVLWPLAAYVAFVLLLVGGVLVVSHILGEHHEGRARGEPYESGILSTGSARVRLSTKFYLVALLFVLFDLEAVFIFAWAIAVPELGWHGYCGLLVFVALLIVVYQGLREMAKSKVARTQLRLLDPVVGYALGAMAMFWFLERLPAVWGA